MDRTVPILGQDQGSADPQICGHTVAGLPDGKSRGSAAAVGDDSRTDRGQNRLNDIAIRPRASAEGPPAPVEGPIGGRKVELDASPKSETSLCFHDVATVEESER
jgi:hypothetical protein